MNIVIVGTGYVGLVTGACFAEMGLNVTCVDVDAEKISALQKGIIPIHEPGLEALVKTNYAEGRLHFTTSMSDAMQSSNIYFIAVGTPPGEDGSADLQHVLAVACDIGRNMKDYAVIIDKSTVPVGTADRVHETIHAELDKRKVDISFDVVSNPEFLKEGAAVEDFMKPERIVIGSDSNKANEIMRQIYAPFNRNHERIVFMGVRDAEMTKYAANAMLATKISFINEIAMLCERLGVDVENVRRGIGSDQRIGYHFIYPGCGYGGSCFPKDVKALIHTAELADFHPTLLHAVEARNRAQKGVLFEKIIGRFGSNLAGLSFGIWGLAFKPGTDDMREASSVILIEALISAGAKVRTYDPVAMHVAKNCFPAAWFDKGQLSFSEHQYAALQGAAALVLVTEWKPFRTPDFVAMKKIMKHPIIFDGRNQFDPSHVRAEGFEYSGIGRV